MLLLIFIQELYDGYNFSTRAITTLTSVKSYAKFDYNTLLFSTKHLLVPYLQSNPAHEGVHRGSYREPFARVFSVTCYKCHSVPLGPCYCSCAFAARRGDLWFMKVAHAPVDVNNTDVYISSKDPRLLSCVEVDIRLEALEEITTT